MMGIGPMNDKTTSKDKDNNFKLQFGRLSTVSGSSKAVTAERDKPKQANFIIKSNNSKILNLSQNT